MKEIFALAVKKVRTIYYELVPKERDAGTRGVERYSMWFHLILDIMFFTLFWFYDEQTLERKFCAQILLKDHMNSEYKYPYLIIIEDWRT